MTHPGTPGGADTPRPPLADLVTGMPPAASPTPGGMRSSGDDEFARFYHQYFARLVAFLVYQHASVDLAVDIAQDAMITAYRKWPEITHPRAYVFKVAGRAYTRCRLGNPEQPIGEVSKPTVALPRPGETEAWLQQQEIIEVLRRLPPRQCQVLALTIDGWTPTEIAQLLDIEPEAVRASLMKARRSAAAHRLVGEEAP